MWCRAVLVIATAAAVPILTTAEPAAAEATYVVTTTSDTFNLFDGQLSLREAVWAANIDGDDSNIRLQPGATYVLTSCGSGDEDTNWTGDLDHTDSRWLVITGDAEEPPTITTSCAQRHLENRGTGALGIAWVRLTGGAPESSDPATPTWGGSIESLGPVLTFEAAFTDNQAVSATGGPPSSGGAIAADSVWSIGTTFERNSAGVGGAIAMHGGAGATAWIQSSAFRANQAGSGGSIATGFLNMVDSTVRESSASGFGGGAFAADASIRNSTFLDNDAGYAGGDLYARGAAGSETVVGDENPIEIASSTFLGSSAVGACGSILTGYATMTSVEVAGATAGYGGGICAYSSRWPREDGQPGLLRLTDSAIHDNVGTYEAGGINASATVVMTRSLIARNHTRGDGGGLLVRSLWVLQPQVRIDRSQFDGNVAGGKGGGIKADGTALGGSFEAVNTSFIANSAATGGGIHLGGGTLHHTTFSGNSAGAGAAIASTAGPLVLRANAIGEACAVPANTVSQGRNTDADGTCGLTTPQDLPFGTFLDAGPTFTAAGQSAATVAESWLGDWIASCTVKVDQVGTERPLGHGCTPGAIETFQWEQAGPDRAPQPTEAAPVPAGASSTFDDAPGVLEGIVRLLDRRA